MSQSSSAPVQNNPAPVQNNPLPEIRPIDTLVNLLDKLFNNKEAITMILNLYVGHINDIVDPITKTNLLMWAIDKKHRFCADAIISTSINKKHVDCNGDSALTYAVKRHLLERAQILIEKNFDINHMNYSNQTALSLTITAGFVQEAIIMINNGAKIKLVDKNIVAKIDKELIKRASQQIDPQETEEVKTAKKTTLIALLTLRTAFNKK